MSQFLNSVGIQSMLLVQDERLNVVFHRWTGSMTQARPWLAGALWTRSCGLGDTYGLFGMDSIDVMHYESDQEFVTGGQQQKRIIGTSRDSNGNPLGSCTIKAYTTADDIERGSCVSDAAGYFECPTYMTGAHYLVAYKGGSPDVSGTTVNTITGV